MSLHLQKILSLMLICLLVVALACYGLFLMFSPVPANDPVISPGDSITLPYLIPHDATPSLLSL